MLHLVTGWKTPEGNGKPDVLYCDHDARGAKEAVNAAGPEYLRVELATVPFSLKQSRPAHLTKIISNLPAPILFATEEDAAIAADSTLPKKSKR